MTLIITNNNQDREINALIARMKRAAASGVWNGQELTPYFARCRHVDYRLGVSAIYSRDTGHHSSGWWKNPDYERCRHLSLSFFDPEAQQFTGQRNHTLTAMFIEAIFGSHKRWLWCEPPYSDDGKKNCVWHYRLFCDPAWEPIMPRGEVYNRELTEAGYKSWSDVQEELRIEREAIAER